MRTSGTIIAAILTGLIGYYATQAALGSTTLASQAATAGGVIAMLIFFGTLYLLKKMSDGYDVQSKIKQISTKSRSKTEVLGIDTGQNKKLAAIARTAQRGLLIKSEDHIPKIRSLLMRAGKMGDRAIFVTIIIQALLAVAGLVIPHLLAAIGLMGDLSLMMVIAIGLCCAGVGFYLPILVLKAQGKSRSANLFIEFPDALDLVTIYVESGHTFDAALERVVSNIGKRYPTVAFELRVLEHELRYYTDRAQAFRNLADRCDIDMIRRLASIIEQNEAIGSPIAESLKILAHDSRMERFLEAERKAAKIPVIMQVPIVLFILPSLFLFILGPTAIKIFNIFAKLIQ